MLLNSNFVSKALLEVVGEDGGGEIPLGTSGCRTGYNHNSHGQNPRERGVKEGTTPACRNCQWCVKAYVCEVECDVLNSKLSCWGFLREENTNKQRYHNKVVYTVNPQSQGETVNIFTAGKKAAGRKLVTLHYS